MALVTRGRLSVQRVEEATWGVLETLAATGGWEEGARASKPKAKARGRPAKAKEESPAKAPREPENTTMDDDEEAAEVERALKEEPLSDIKPTGRKRKAREVEPDDDEAEEAKPLRRSTRARK